MTFVIEWKHRKTQETVTYHCEARDRDEAFALSLKELLADKRKREDYILERIGWI